MRSRTTVLLLTSLLCASCASSKMRLEVALYDGDPRVEFTAPGVQAVLAQLMPLKQDVMKVAAARKEVAKAAVDVYEAYIAAFLNPGSASAAGPRSNLPKFDAAVQVAVEEFDVDVASARSSGELFLAAKDRTAAREAAATFRTDIGSVQSVYYRLLSFKLGGAAKNFEDGLLTLIPDMIESIVALSDAELPTGTKKEDLIATMENVLAKLAALPNRQFDAIKGFEASVNSLGAAQGGANLKAAANSALVTLTGALSTSDEGLEKLQRRVLAAQIGASLVDSVQDAGDPVWRQVAAPENAHHWNTQFEESYAYAEGNYSVVIVQDSPLSYRVQRSSNDPRALVAGQLAISRAVANAAIEVASAAAGVPGKPLGTAPSSAPAGTTNATKTLSVGVTRARLDSEARARSKARAAVETAVEGIGAQIAALVPPAAPAADADAATKTRYETDKAAYLERVEALRDDLKARLTGALSGFPTPDTAPNAQGQSK